MKMNSCRPWFRALPAEFRSSSGLLLLFALALAGCSPKAEVVVIRGSNTVGEELVPRLIAEFRKTHANVLFDTEFKGTSYGLGALMVDRCDIAAASREATTNEVELAHERGVALNDYVIGTYSVAVIVNINSPVGSLTKDQVRDIFTGTADSWKQVGFADTPIHVHIRDPISGTYLGFQELAMDKKPYAMHVKTFTNYMSIVQAVARDPDAIGYCSVELARRPGIRPVFVGGVPPTADLVNKGSYPYARVLRFYTSKAKESSTAAEFIRFVESAEGQKILDDMGCVPKP